MGPSTSWTSNVAVLRLRRRSFKPLLRRLKLPLSKRRTRCSGLNLSLDKSARRLTVASRRRRRSLKTLAKTINAPWTPWLPLEAEQRAKGEALRIKKKLESDINEL